MRAPGLLLAGSLSLLPFALAVASDGALSVDGASWLALALAPWLALAGLPRGPGPGVRGGWAVVAAGCLPLGALGWGADVAAGRGLAGPSSAAVGAILVVGLWSGTAEAARGHPLAARVQGLAWLLLVPGSTALVVALGWAPRTGAAAAAPWLERLGDASPLVWCAGWGAAPAGREVVAGGIASAAAALAVLACVLVLRRGASGAAP